MGIGLIIVVMVENEQGYEDFTDTSVRLILLMDNTKFFLQFKLHESLLISYLYIFYRLSLLSVVV